MWLASSSWLEWILGWCGRLTHSFQAQGFDTRFGYSECGRTPGNPRGYDDIHMM